MEENRDNEPMRSMPERVAAFPSSQSALGWKSWSRELAAAAFDTVLPRPRPGENLPPGDGSAVLLIPGFLSGDWAFVRLKRFIAALGYRTITARIAFNPGPTPAIVSRLDRALLDAARDGKVALVGISLGGTLARDMARRHADKVRCVVTLCSPVRFPVITPLEPFARALAPWHDRDWVARRHDIGLPLTVPVTAIHSVNDGVVDWRQCVLDEAPRVANIAVRGNHMMIASNPQAQAVVARALAAQSAETIS